MTEERSQRAFRGFGTRAMQFWMTISAAALIGTTATAQTKLSSDPHGYPRVRLLPSGEILASGTAFGTSSISILSSTNTGVSFSKVGQITDPDFADGLCCGTIFRLPQTVGSLAPGTLLWAGSVRQNVANRRMKIKVYESNDNGRNWTYLSAIAAPNTGGLWEPDFFMANDGALVMVYSDETMSGTYSQRLMKTRTYNGVNWVDAGNLVASTIKADRPGMAFVSKLANGDRIMTYELYGPAACTVFYKTSTDGWNWGPAANVGSAIRLSDGRYFAHAPTNKVMPDGALLVVGQLLMNANNTIAAGNGTVIFKSASGSPAGPWKTIAAPVPVPGATNRPCVNYSSSLLPISGGTRLLEIAGRLDSNVCYLYFGTGPSN